MNIYGIKPAQRFNIINTMFKDVMMGAIKDEVAESNLTKNDSVNHPKHYTSHPSGIEIIQITEHMNFCLGNAVKYICRAGIKTSDPTEDLKKAIWYLNREIERVNK